ncbi:MAG: hypothetical protein ISS45_08005 [Candidatus Omnitrophica bacterium]|nr:hypothetical protein [Candidatus Omnitrophota bacterium]
MEANKRLRQAEYHLGKLKNIKKNKDIYMFNLVAFIESIRAATWYLQKEFNKLPEFKIWYKKKQEEFKKNSFFSFFNEKRRFVVHEGYPETKGVGFGKFYYIGSNGTLRTGEYMAKLDAAPITIIIPGGSVTVFASGAKIRASSEYFKGSEYKISHYFAEFPKINIIDLCKDHLNKVRLVCSEWDNLYKGIEKIGNKDNDYLSVNKK